MPKKKIVELIEPKKRRTREEDIIFCNELMKDSAERANRVKKHSDLLEKIIQQHKLMPFDKWHKWASEVSEDFFKNVDK